MSEKAAQALKATVGPRHIGSLLLLVAAAACAVAATTAWVSIRLQMEPGTWGPGPRPAPTTIGSVDQHATLLEQACLLALALAIVAVGVIAVTRKDAGRRVAPATAILIAGMVGVFIARLRMTSAMLSEARSSYPANFPDLVGARNVGSWLLIGAAVIAAIGGLVLAIDEDAAAPGGERWMRAFLWSTPVFVVPLTVAALMTQWSSAVSAVVVPLQTTATESATLFVAEQAWSQCMTDCSATGFETMQRDDLQFPQIVYSAGTTTSVAGTGDIVVSIQSEDGTRPGQARVGMAALSDSGLCVLLVIPDASEHPHLFGSTADRGRCSGEEALRSATAATPDSGGWTVLSGLRPWPAGNWSVGPGPAVDVGV